MSGNEIYDHAGNLVSNPTAGNVYDSWKFDAAGRNFETKMAWDESIQDRRDTITHTLDGDGLAVKRVDLKETFMNSSPPQNFSTTWTKYYVRSTVLGGKVLTEIRDDGTKKQTNVYAGDAVIAEQMSFPADAQHPTEWGFVKWKYEDPVTGSYRKKSDGGVSGPGDDSPWSAELEPLGGSIPDADPYDPDLPAPIELGKFQYGGDVFRPEDGCVVDGMMQDSPGLCTKMLDNGAGIPAPLAQYQHLPGFQFSTNGLGIFTVRLPRQVGWHVTYGPNDGPNGTAHPVYSGSNAYSFSVNWGPQAPALTHEQGHGPQQQGARTSSEHSISQDCINALSDLGIWDEVKELMEHPPLFDIESMPGLFGSVRLPGHKFLGRPAADDLAFFYIPGDARIGESFGDAFDRIVTGRESFNRQLGQVSGALTVRGPTSGGIIYYRGSKTNLLADVYLRLHEVVHLVFPQKITTGRNLDLDIVLANELQLIRLDPNESASDAVSRFFNNRCDPSLRDFGIQP